MAASAATQEAICEPICSYETWEWGADEPMVLDEDNESCIALFSGPADYNRSKHTDIRYHLINEKLAKKEIVMRHAAITIQIADMLIKGS